MSGGRSFETMSYKISDPLEDEKETASAQEKIVQQSDAERIFSPNKRLNFVVYKVPDMICLTSGL